MQELARAIDKAADIPGAEGMEKILEEDDPVLYALEKAAEKWGMCTLRAHNGKLREQGLRISTAILDFVDLHHKLNRGAHDND